MIHVGYIGGNIAEKIHHHDYNVHSIISLRLLKVSTNQKRGMYRFQSYQFVWSYERQLRNRVNQPLVGCKYMNTYVYYSKPHYYIQ